MTETVTEQELEEARGKYGDITFKLTTEEYQKKFLAVEKHMKKRKGAKNHVDVLRNLLDFYLVNSPSYNF